MEGTEGPTPASNGQLLEVATKLEDKKEASHNEKAETSYSPSRPHATVRGVCRTG